MGLEVGDVLLLVGGHVAADEGQALGADDVVRGGRALAGDAFRLGVAGEAQGGVVALGEEYHGAAGGAGNVRAQAGVGHRVHGSGPQVGPVDGPGAACLQVALGLVHQADHALVGFARRRPESEQAVVHEHQALQVVAPCLTHQAGAFAGQIEAGHDVRQYQHPITVHGAHVPFALGVVGEGEEGVGVGVVHVLGRDDGVQDGLHRGGGGVGAQGVGLQFVDHLRVGEGLQLGQPAQVVQVHRGKALGLDEFQVPAAPLDVEDVPLLAEEIRLAHLHRGVAAAVQHQGFVPSQQARGVHPLPQIARILPGLFVVPQAVHASLPVFRPRMSVRTRLLPAKRDDRGQVFTVDTPHNGPDTQQHRASSPSAASSPNSL